MILNKTILYFTYGFFVVAPLIVTICPYEVTPIDTHTFSETYELALLPNHRSITISEIIPKPPFEIVSRARTTQNPIVNNHNVLVYSIITFPSGRRPLLL